MNLNDLKRNLVCRHGDIPLILEDASNYRDPADAFIIPVTGFGQ